MGKPRPLSIVKFDKSTTTKEDYDMHYWINFDNHHFIFIGEIPNQPGHCMLSPLSGLDQGKIIGPYHTNNFIEDN